jgi:phosphoribosylglycinamide formyltransferase 2
VAAVAAVGTPCIIKPVMSSSGKGQMTVREPGAAAEAWRFAMAGARAARERVIVEGFVDFDYEITLLTVRHAGGTDFCAPIGHLQIDGDYRESWQPQPMSAVALERSRDIARTVTAALGGYGVFGVELFIKGDEVYFSEVSPRPHDTGMVTMISQPWSQFALHVRAILGVRLPPIEAYGPSASCAILGSGHGSDIRYRGWDQAMAVPGTDLRIFGKPNVAGKRRLAVALARGENIEEARAKARAAAACVEIVIS